MTAMKAALRVLLGCGVLLVVLGVIVWTGNDALVPVHVAVGVVLVLALWTLAALAARAGAPAGTVAFAATWGLVVAALGMTQESLAPGRWHWTIQALHVAVSMGALWWGRRLVRVVGQARVATAPVAVGGGAA